MMNRVMCNVERVGERRRTMRVGRYIGGRYP
jgi:hypothetical protein